MGQLSVATSPQTGSGLSGNQHGCLQSAVEIDGCQDTMRFERPHIYPFGLGDGLKSLFTTSTFGFDVGYCDGLHITSPLFFVGTAVHSYTGISGNSCFGMLTTSGFDTYGGLLIEDGQWEMTGGYGTLAEKSNLSLNQTGGDVTASGMWFYSATQPDQAQLYSNGGTLSLTGCRFDTGAFDARSLWIDPGCVQASIVGSKFTRKADKAFGQPQVLLNGSRGSMVGNTFTPPTGGGAGTALYISQDTPWTIGLNDLGGQGIVVPDGFTKLNLESQPEVLLPAFASSAAAKAAGLGRGRRFRNGEIVQQVIS